jgi:hypothetical protein
MLIIESRLVPAKTESTSGVLKRKETTKLTKHGFLDKIKNAAKASQGGVDGGDLSNERDQKRRRDSNGKSKDAQETSKSSWSALKDDYMLNPKKVSQ